MKKTIYLLLLCLSGCITSQKQAQNKINQIVEDFPAVISSLDSTTQEVSTASFDETFYFATDESEIIKDKLQGKVPKTTIDDVLRAVAQSPAKNIKRGNSSATIQKSNGQLKVIIHRDAEKINVKSPVNIIKVSKPEPTGFEKFWIGIKTFLKNFFWYFFFPIILLIVIYIIYKTLKK